MKGKLLFFILSTLCVFIGCSSNDTPNDTTYNLGCLSYQNDSSHNLAVQYFFNSEYYNEWFNYDGSNDNVYGIIVDILPMASNQINDDFSLYFPIEKVLIVETDTHKLLQKTDADTFFSMLSKEIRIEKKDNETITYYYDHFIITDEFLGRE
jgi:hypothetical protein